MKAVVSVLFSALGAWAAEESGSLFIASPPGLRTMFPPSGQVGMSPAMFGVPANGGRRMTGHVVLAPSNDEEGCLPIDKSLIADWPTTAQKLQIIIMVERGNCTFVTKVRHAEEIGADAVIIVDNQDEVGLPYMADDGHGGDIQIPSMLIHKNDGKTIREYVENEHTTKDPVVSTMSWNYANDDNSVEWELWATPGDIGASQLKTNFEEAIKVLGDSAVFTAHLYLEQWGHCVNLDAKVTTDMDPDCLKYCTNQGRYCNLFNDNGASTVEEGLRSLCVFRQVNASAPEKWFQYSAAVNKLSPGHNGENGAEGTKQFTKALSDGVMTSIGVDPTKVQKCVDESGGSGPFDGENKILEEELYQQHDVKIIRFNPTILINGLRYTGSFSCNEPLSFESCGLLKSMCAAFLDEEVIKACTTTPGCPLGQKVDAAQNCGGTCEFDVCGLCLETWDAKFNQTCLGCDKVPHSGLVFDSCGNCGGPGIDKCGRCLQDVGTNQHWIPLNSTLSCKELENKTKIIRRDTVVSDSGVAPWKIVLIAVASVLIAALGVVYCMKRRQARLKHDIDELLKAYRPMTDQEGGHATKKGNKTTIHGGGYDSAVSL